MKVIKVKKAIIFTNRCCNFFSSLLFSFPEAEHDHNKQKTNSNNQRYGFTICVSLFNCGRKINANGKSRKEKRNKFFVNFY